MRLATSLICPAAQLDEHVAPCGVDAEIGAGGGTGLGEVGTRAAPVHDRGNRVHAVAVTGRDAGVVAVREVAGLDDLVEHPSMQRHTGTDARLPHATALPYACDSLAVQRELVDETTVGMHPVEEHHRRFIRLEEEPQPRTEQALPALLRRDPVLVGGQVLQTEALRDGMDTAPDSVKMVRSSAGCSSLPTAITRVR